MKKFLLLLALWLMSMPAYATYWYEFSEKAYIDLDSIKKSNNIGFAWVKLLNNGNIEPINNKKVWYAMNTIYVDLKRQKTAIKDIYFYDLNNKKIEDHTFETLDWGIIIPDSMGESLYNIIEKYPRLEKLTNEQHWVELSPGLELDIYSLLMTNSECCNMWIKMDAKNITDVKRKTKYVKTFMSVNLVKRQAALLEVKEYDKNDRILSHKKDNSLSYSNIGEDGIVNYIIDYIYKLSNMLDKSSNPPLE